MGKRELIQTVAEDAGGISYAATSRVIEALSSHITNELFHGRDVVIPGIGKLSAAKRAPKTARNPITGEPVHVPERLAAKFTASSTLKKALNGG